MAERRARSFGERLDRVIGVVAPMWAARRMAARRGMDILSSSYVGAEKNRLRDNWVAGAGSADEDLLADLPTLRERSRDANRNIGIAAGITDTFEMNVIGTGIRTQSRMDHERIGIAEDEADALQREAEYHFERWAEETGFYELQALMIRQLVENGEAILLRQKTDVPGRLFDLEWELIESDRLDTPPGTDVRRVRSGVELNERGKPVAYHFRKTHPGDITHGDAPGMAQFQRVPAYDSEGRPNVIHLFRKKRAGQTRGIPFFAPVLTYFKDLADYMEAEIVAARIAACFAVFVKTNDPRGSAKANAKLRNGKRIEELEPGMIEYLGPDEDIAAFNPNRPSNTFEPFMVSLVRMICAALGLPYELVVKDFTKTTYTSARAALQEARRMFRVLQVWLSKRVCQESWNLVQEEAYLKGLWSPPNFYRFKYEYTRTNHIPPGWTWVDPQKEVDSSLSAIDGNLSTLAYECAAQGRDWEEVLKQRQKEKKRMEELGVTPEQAVPAGPGRPPAKGNDKPNKEDAADEDAA